MKTLVTTEPVTANYALGHSPAEIRRLRFQAAILRPITMRLLQGDGERSPIATWLAETLRTLLPQII